MWEESGVRFLLAWDRLRLNAALEILEMAYWVKNVSTIEARMGNPTNRWSCPPEGRLELSV